MSKGFTTAQRVAMALNGQPVPACQWRCLKWQWGSSTGKFKPEGQTSRSGAPGMCMALHESDSYICTLPAGHEGDHVACASPGTSDHSCNLIWKNNRNTNNQPKEKHHEASQ